MQAAAMQYVQSVRALCVLLLLAECRGAWYAPSAGNSSGLYPKFLSTQPWCNPATRNERMYVSLSVTVNATMRDDPCRWPGRCTSASDASSTRVTGYGLNVTVVLGGCNLTLSVSGGPGGPDSVVFEFSSQPPWLGGSLLHVPHPDDTPTVSTPNGALPTSQLCNITIIVECVNRTCECAGNGYGVRGSAGAEHVRTSTAAGLTLQVHGNCTSSVAVNATYSNVCSPVTGDARTYMSSTGSGPTDGARFLLGCT